MDSIRENKTLAAILGVMVAGGLGLAAWLYMNYSSYAASREQFETANSGLATLKGAKLFPSPENEAKKQAEADGYQAAVGRLSAALLILQPKNTPMSGTEFQAKLEQRSQQTAEAAKAAGVKLPREKFGFGFDTYFGTLPKPEATTELTSYLDSADQIVNMMIGSGIVSLDSFDRSELAVEKGAPPPKPEPPKTTASKPKKSKSKSKDGAKKGPPPKEIAKAVERRTVKTTFTTDQGPLQKILNTLASPSKMPHFAVVRLLRVENEKQEGPPKIIPVTAAATPAPAPEPAPAPAPAADSAPPAPADGAAAAAAAAGAQAAKREILEPAKPSTPDAVAVLGEEKLKVFLEIDIVRFVEPASTAEAAANP